MIPLALLTETVTVDAYEGVNGHGAAIYGSPVDLRARFEGKRRMVKRADGQEVITSGTVLLRPDVSCPMKSRLTRDGRAYKVVEVLPVLELNRPHHLEVLVS
ncbi:MAG: putative minor capsid protein [Actinobacteria bacterium]|nr:putative minor capsid protein [Actinomycetota bacterium]